MRKPSCSNSANGTRRSKFNDQRRIKTFAELIWIAPLISQYPGRTDHVVHVVMGVPVDPERNMALFNQLIQVGSERRFEQTVGVIRSLRTRTGRVMCHNDGVRAITLGQLAAQPG